MSTDDDTGWDGKTNNGNGSVVPVSESFIDELPVVHNVPADQVPRVLAKLAELNNSSKSIKLESYVDPTRQDRVYSNTQGDTDLIAETAALFGLTRRDAKEALLRARERVHGDVADMAFTEALRIGRPMRRRAWLNFGPTVDAAKRAEMDAAIKHWWVYPAVLVGPDGAPGGQSIWINIGNGRRAVISLEDYLAADWEVMP